MNKTVLFNFTADKANNKIFVERSFDAPLDLVWAAWTESDILDQWWAPKPYVMETYRMDFKPGGQWFYSMTGPNGDKHYCLFDIENVEKEKRYSGIDAFCDEQANISNAKPRVHWNNSFVTNDGDTTIVHVEMTFATLNDLETIISMGFKEGFSMGLSNLDQYIAAQFYLRKSKKTNTASRVSTYVNFDGNTEEAFEFYRQVFKTEFVNGIQRFGDIPSGDDQPPVQDEIKKMILHVELPLLGNHILMGTDAPKEMGFTVKAGNNMHICLEPDSREESKRLFDELSVDGIIEMPIADTFWGAYYGSFQDKYGINWMINYQN